MPVFLARYSLVFSSSDFLTHYTKFDAGVMKVLDPDETQSIRFIDLCSELKKLVNCYSDIIMQMLNRPMSLSANLFSNDDVYCINVLDTLTLIKLLLI